MSATFVKDHQKDTSDSTYTYNHRVSEILNDSMVMLTNPDGKVRKCNINYIKLMTPVDASTNAFNQFQDSIKKTPCDTACHQLQLKIKNNIHLKFSAPIPCGTLKPLLCMYTSFDKHSPSEY